MKFRLPAWLWLAAIIVVVAFAGYLYSPYAGDDLVYAGIRADSVFDYPRVAAGHWLSTNGRLGDKLLIPFLAAPRPLLALVCALALGLMYVYAVLCARVRGFAAVALVAALALVLPWWDSMYQFCCQFNYVWPSAFVLIAFSLVNKSATLGRLQVVLSAVFCFFAGMMHEAAGVPLCFGWLVMIAAKKCRPHRRQWLLLGAFAVGTFCSIVSPGLWARFGAMSDPDDAALPLLFKSDAVAVFLWVTILVCLLFRQGRDAVRRLFDSPLGVFAIAAAASAAVSVASGIVGRSGWFAELYALIALAGWASMYFIFRHRSPTVILSVIVAAQAVGVAVCQVRLGREYREFEEAYTSAQSGVVYMDCTRDTDIPWWTLGRLRGVPDPDDLYLLYCLSQYRHPAGAWPVVVPSEVRTAVAGRLQNGDILCDTLPPSVRYISFSPGQPQVGLVEIDGREWTAQRVGHLYHLSPRIIDPGDRF